MVECKYCNNPATMKGYRERNGQTSSEVVCYRCNDLTNEAIDKLNKDYKYPFEEGDDYWTIEDGEVIWSCWDEQSEILHDENPTRIYYVTEKKAKKNL